MILAIFDLQVTQTTKFGVYWPFSSGEEAKNWFSKWLLWQPSWISDRNDFIYFWSTSHPDASYQVSSQLTQGCRRSRLLKQLLTPHNGHWLTTIAHYEHFMLRWANKPFDSGEEMKNRFSWWPLWRPSWISDFSTILAIFDLQSCQCFLPSLESIGLSVQEKKRKIDFQDGSHDGHLGFPICKT